MPSQLCEAIDLPQFRADIENLLAQVPEFQLSHDSVEQLANQVLSAAWPHDRFEQICRRFDSLHADICITTPSDAAASSAEPENMSCDDERAWLISEVKGVQRIPTTRLLWEQYCKNHGRNRFDLRIVQVGCNFQQHGDVALVRTTQLGACIAQRGHQAPDWKEASNICK